MLNEKQEEDDDDKLTYTGKAGEYFIGISEGSMDDDDKLTYTGKEGEYCEYSRPMACNAHHAALSPPDDDDKWA